MADIIQLLPDPIANQIAAGEVIQRPASAVKELLENAIDADATRIHLIIRDAGKELIQVNDNGKGMSPTDARMSFERHATSKIRQIDDLFAIRTMGFRGEALASMAAVAQMEMKSRRAEDETGIRLLTEASRVVSQEPCQAPQGTMILVKNLFYNVPARRNFLKSNNVETRHIIDEFTRVAMAFPGIAFRFTNNDTDVFMLEPGNLKQRILGLLGQQFNAKLVPVEEETGVVNIQGFIGSPDAAAKTRGNQYFFVNNRFIRSAYLNHAVSQGFRDLIPNDEFPLFVLFIDIDPQRLDINVHPTKQEIKFDDERIVYSFVNSAVKHALSKYSIAPSLDFTLHAGIEALPAVTQPFSNQQQRQTENDFLFQSFSQGGQAHLLHRSNDVKHWKELYKVQQGMAFPTDSEQDNVHTAADLFSPHFVQLAQAYVMATTKSGCMFIDQHLAHRRILYERYEHALQEGIPIQRSLIPKTLELNPTDALLLTNMLDDLKLLGYAIEPFGQFTFIIQGTPGDMPDHDEKAAIEKLLDLYKHEASDIRLDKREKLIRTMAAQQATPYGRRLQEPEMQELFQQLLRCEQPQLSPEGKKIFVRVSGDDLGNMIQRG
jgi:DNA mismatch repair protein MutL